MDEQELDDWFQTEREKLEEETLKALNENQTDETAKERFDKAYRKLLTQYQRKQDFLYRKQRLKKRIDTPIRQAKHAMKERKKAVKKFLADKRLTVRKWLFDRKIRRILRKN